MYKRNRATGEILRRETVEIKCDKCGKQWEVVYKSRKAKVLKDDLCDSCRAKLVLSRQIIKPFWSVKRPDKKIEITCLNCGIKKLKIPSLINKVNNFCSVSCRDEYWLKINYGHLEQVFENNPNEVAYLIGLIMGDGSVRKSGKQTVRVGIAFDFSGKWDILMDLTKTILNKLQINWFEEQKQHNNCKMIGFVLPNFLMKKYGIFYYGDKFKTQPFPSEAIYGNINYVAGLLNSDGYHRQYYYFVNTVKSIVDSFTTCLLFNEIRHRITERDGKPDKRTNNIGKKQYIVYIGGNSAVTKLKQICAFKLKE